MLFFSCSMYLIGLLMFCMKRKHLLLMLMSLEFIILTLYLNLMFYLCGFSEFYFSMIFLVLSVCESVLGLSILVSLIRTHGNDFFGVFNLLW